MTVYPNNIPVIANGSAAVLPELFDLNVTGRITPVDNFTVLEDSIEYFFFFALAPVQQQTEAGAAIYDAEIVEFTSGCPAVATSVVYLRTGPVDPVAGGLVDGSNTSTLKQVCPADLFCKWLCRIPREC